MSDTVSDDTDDCISPGPEQDPGTGAGPKSNGVEGEADMFEGDMVDIADIAQSLDSKQMEKIEDEGIHKEWRDESKFMFSYHIAIALILNAVEGLIPCVLPEISKKFGMNSTQQGFLGGFYYIAWALSAPFCGIIIKNAKHRVKDVMLCAFLLCILLTAALAFIPPSFGPWGPIMIQTALGICVGIPSNVGSVWINVFSTPDVRTSWTGAYQATMVLGAVLGYAFGTMFHWATGYHVLGGYQISLSVIVLIEICIFSFLLFFPRKHFNVNAATNRLSNVEGAPLRNIDYILTVPDILCDPGFMTGTLMMSFLFFVVRGIQYWSTVYLERQFPHVSGFFVRCSFLGVSVTAPLLGLFVGSQIGDCIGELYENNRREKFYKNLLCADLFAICASLCGFPALSHDYFFVVVISVWGVLFFGAMLLPLVSVTLLEILPPTHRIVGNGFYSLMIGIIGYSISISSLGGLAAIDFYICWTVLLNMSWVAVVFGLLMTCYLRPTGDKSDIYVPEIVDEAGCISLGD